MKTFKSLMTTFVIMIAVAAVYANKTHINTKTAHRDAQWYTYNGGPINNVNSFDLITGALPECGGTGEICRVNIEEGSGTHPDATALNDPTLQAQVANVKSGLPSQGAVLAKE